MARRQKALKMAMLHLLKILFYRLRRYDITLGKGTHIALTAKLVSRNGSIIIGSNSSISDGVIVSTYGGHVTIGNNVSINPYCVLYGHGGLVIGDDCRIATGVTIIPANHVFKDTDIPVRKQGLTMQGIHIGKDVWIGTGARILDGVQIGDKSIVGAGAVVTKNVASGVIVAGVPARPIGNR